jgi:TolA-binding protein
MTKLLSILLLLFSFSIILPAASFKAAKSKKETKLKFKTEKKQKDEARKKALEKLAQMKKKKLDLYSLTDDDLASLEKKEKEINEKDKEQIQLLERMIKNPNLSDDQKAERMFRLAELKWESSKFSYLRQRKEYELKMDKCLEDKTIQCPKDEPVANYSESIKIYKTILKKLPRYDRIDEVIYYLGYGLQRAGNPSQSVSYFKKIVLKYPKSEYLAKAYFSLGEYFFDNNSFVAAKKNYEKVLEDKNSDIYDLGMYKMGWVYYNLGSGATDDAPEKWTNLDKSLSYFKYSIEKSTKAIAFKTQAKNDLVLVMSEYKDAFDRVKSYFYKLDGQKEAIKRLNNLGELLLAQGKDTQVIEVYRYLIESAPTGKRVPEYYSTILETETRLLDKAKIAKTFREIIDYFAPDSDWVRANTGKEWQKEGFELGRKLLQERAITFHEKGQKCTPNNKKVKCDKVKLYLKAGDLYKEYIDKYPTSKEAYQDSFYYAEILFYHKKDYQEAANYYEKIFKDPSAKEYYADAAFGMILALEKLMKDEMERLQGQVDIKESKEAGSLDKKTRVEFTPRQRQYVVACDNYIKVVKSPKEKPKVAYGAARLFYEKAQYEESIKRFQDIIKNYKGTKFASLAGNLILDTYNRLKNYQQIENWAEILLKNKDFTYNKQDKLVIFVRQSILKQGEEALTNGKYLDAANHFIRLAGDQRFKNDLTIAPDALERAAVVYGLAKDEVSANRILLRIVNEYPKSELAPKSLFTLGKVHSLRAKFKQAADYFSMLSKYPENKEYTADGLYNAISLYAALGDTKSSISLIDTYIKIYGKEKDPAKIKDIESLKYKRGEIFEIVKDYKKANNAYEEYISKYNEDKNKIIELKIRMGKNELKIKKNNFNEAKKYFKEALKLFDDNYITCKNIVTKKGRTKITKKECKITFSPKKGTKKEIEFIYTKNLIGDILFTLADSDYQKYISLSKAIKSTPAYKPRSSAERGMQQKIKEMKALYPKLRDSYTNILNYESPVWTVAASYRLGKIYGVFAETLFKAPLPKGLSEDEEFVYRDMLDEIAIPLQEKAIQNYDAVLKVVKQNKFYNKWYSKTAFEIVKYEGRENLFPAAKYSYKDTSYQDSYLKFKIERKKINPIIERKKEDVKDKGTALSPKKKDKKNKKDKK